MSLHQTLQVYELLDSAQVDGDAIVTLFASFPDVRAESWHVVGDQGKTDFVRIVIPGLCGKLSGGEAPTLGIIGRLGGIGARPARIGMVSDADGAVAALASALKLAEMGQKGDRLPGDVIVTTHICPDAPTLPHYPVDFMGSPVDPLTMNRNDTDLRADAILSIDTTKGNRILNYKGIAITPTVKQGYILRIAEDLIHLLEMTSGRPAATLPITTQDITPYGNGIFHINSIMQPATVTPAPVVGVAICTESIVPGCGTGASHETDIAVAVKFAVEVAKSFGHGSCQFYDADEFERLIGLYGEMTHLQLD